MLGGAIAVLRGVKSGPGNMTGGKGPSIRVFFCLGFLSFLAGLPRVRLPLDCGVRQGHRNDRHCRRRRPRLLGGHVGQGEPAAVDHVQLLLSRAALGC